MLSNTANDMSEHHLKLINYISLRYIKMKYVHPMNSVLTGNQKTLH